MVDELKRARMGVKIDDQWCSALLYSIRLILYVDRHRSGVSGHVGCGVGFCG